MSFIAAVLLLNMDVADAFVCFANLLNRPCQVAFFRVDESLVSLRILSGAIIYSRLKFYNCVRDVVVVIGG